MQLRVGNALHRPAREMHELTVGQIAGRPLFVAAVLADAGLHFRFDVTHRLPHGIAESGEEFPVFGQGVKQRHALRDATR